MRAADHDVHQPAAPGGLTEAEALARLARGEGNRAPAPTSRSYVEIVRENVFNFVNVVLFGLGAALVALGRPGDALVSVGVVAANALVGVIQEVRAKRTLDRIALLTRPTATVVRDGRPRGVDPGDLVRGDVVEIRPGEQVVADGRIVGSAGLEVDESLLTGESDPVPKSSGSPVYSGSFAVAGSGYYEATDVGAASLAQRMSQSARAFRRRSTPLQREINLIIRIVLLLAVSLEFLLVLQSLIARVPAVEQVRMSVVILGLVPNGLILAITVAYAAGAVRIAGSGVLVQQANAMESLSHVDVLCLDKTGTITSGSQRVVELHPLGAPSDRLRRELGGFAASVSAPNRTIAAIARACPGQPRPVAAEVPFSSERKWSALVFADSREPHAIYLGAPETLAGRLEDDREVKSVVADWAGRGLRVVLFARSVEPMAGQLPNQLPDALVPLGLVGIADELRPEARDTLQRFTAAGIMPKIISGDSPLTLAAIVRQVGLDVGGPAVSGADLSGMTPPELDSAAERATLFGRVSPQQKRDLVGSLRRQGHHVAMIGDGVNDVLALKQADLAIALGSGSAAARAVSDLVLIGDSFAALPAGFREGQRIQNGMQDILKLFLTRVAYFYLLFIATGIVGGFPLGPTHNALITLLTVGIPSVLLALWARPGGSGRRSLRDVALFVLPAAMTLVIFSLGVHLVAYLTTLAAAQSAMPALSTVGAHAQATAVSQSALVTFAVVAGLLLLVFVEPPTLWLADGEPLSPDRRPTALALLLFLGYVGVIVSPTLQHWFDLAPLPALYQLPLIGAALVWALVARWTWRARLVERFVDTGADR